MYVHSTWKNFLILAILITDLLKKYPNLFLVTYNIYHSASFRSLRYILHDVHNLTWNENSCQTLHTYFMQNNIVTRIFHLSLNTKPKVPWEMAMIIHFRIFQRLYCWYSGTFCRTKFLQLCKKLEDIWNILHHNLFKNFSVGI